ncbi:hypothetical protein ACLBWP_00365 [Microbacterium sp. M1A1_1b]
MSTLILRVALVVVAVLLAFAPSIVATTTGVTRTTGAAHGGVIACAVVLGLVALVVRTDDQDRSPPVVDTVDPVPWVDPVDPVPWVDPVDDPDTPSEPWDPSDRARASVSSTPWSVPVGLEHDGTPVTLDSTAGIVVIGHGALAVAVFSAVVIALARCASAADDVRTALADDLPSPDDGRVLPGPVRRAATGLGPGTAVAVLLDDRGVRIGSVVLVPDLGSVPRQAGPTLDVTRYGCSARPDPRSARGQRIAPALPALERPDGT